MAMKMCFRWYGEGNDKIKLSDIKQIPGVEGIVWALHHKMPGEIWEESEIAEVKRQLDQYGFNMDVVESVNVHDDIKIGLPTRDKYIENPHEGVYPVYASPAVNTAFPTAIFIALSAPILAVMLSVCSPLVVTSPTVMVTSACILSSSLSVFTLTTGVSSVTSSSALNFEPGKNIRQQ